jgi:hypothetical protein
MVKKLKIITKKLAYVNFISYLCTVVKEQQRKVTKEIYSLLYIYTIYNYILY